MSIAPYIGSLIIIKPINTTVIQKMIKAKVKTYTHYIPILTKYLTTAFSLHANCIQSNPI